MKGVTRKATKQFVPMMRPYPVAETPLLSATAGKNGGNRQTVRLDTQVVIITMQNIRSCLAVKELVKVLLVLLLVELELISSLVAVSSELLSSPVESFLQ